MAEPGQPPAKDLMQFPVPEQPRIRGTTLDQVADSDAAARNHAAPLFRFTMSNNEMPTAAADASIIGTNSADVKRRRHRA
ncbi:MAG: hypothetical protein ACREE7_13920, partial [Dongiaceae bacterium]